MVSDSNVNLRVSKGGLDTDLRVYKGRLRIVFQDSWEKKIKSKLRSCAGQKLDNKVDLHSEERTRQTVWQKEQTQANKLWNWISKWITSWLFEQVAEEIIGWTIDWILWELL